MTWTDERVAELARLWDSGQSASAIGRILGVSKNAVVGKAHRLRLSSRPSPIRHERRTPVRRRVPMLTRPVEPPRTAAPEPAPPVEEPQVVTRRHGKGPNCLWPIGDPRQPDFRFCGAPAQEGKPYCTDHCARAYIVRPSRAEVRAA